MIEIKEVKTRKQRKEFVEFPLNLYKGNDCFVPPLYGDEMAIFKPNYVYNDICESVFYLAYEGNKVVGRISGILHKAANEKWNQKRVRFTRFDSIDNMEVSEKLFQAIEKWALERNMEEICGPLGYSDLEREGLLIEGFDELSTFEEQYNYAYYQKLIENCGYVKEVDWEERKIYSPDVFDEKLERLSTQMIQKLNLKVVQLKSVNKLLKKYSDKIFALLDETYNDLYETVPFTDNMKKMMIKNFKLIISIENISVIVDENDDVVCFGMFFPSIARAVQKSGGRLTIPTIIRILRAVKKPEVLDLCLVGVKREYAQKGVSSLMLSFFMRLLENDSIKYAETNLNLETNHNIINQWKRFNSVLHKKRRSFVKKIKN